MSLFTWWMRRRERRRRERVAKLRAKAAALEARANQVQYSMSHGCPIPQYIYTEMVRDRGEAARCRVMANHYAEAES